MKAKEQNPSYHAARGKKGAVKVLQMILVQAQRPFSALSRVKPLTRNLAYNITLRISHTIIWDRFRVKGPIAHT